MAVRTSNFEIAALDAETSAVNDENVAELNHGSGYFSLWRRPTTGQVAMLQLRITKAKTTGQQMAGFDRFLEKIVLTPEEVVADGRADGEGVPYADRVKDGETAIGVDFLWDLVEREVLEVDNLLDMMREVIEIHSGFPTSSSPDSSQSPTTSGPPSTVTSRRAKSTRSS